MFVSSFHIFSAAKVLRVRVQGTRDDVDPQESTAKGESRGDNWSLVHTYLKMNQRPQSQCDE